jgi:hypothetical protein
MFTQEETVIKVKQAFDEYKLGELNREDIGTIEIHNQVFAKYIDAYRVSLLVQKAYDVGSESTLVAKINLCNDIMKELLFGLEQKRKAYDEANSKKEAK